MVVPLACKVPQDREEQSLLGEASCERKLGFAAPTPPQAWSWGVAEDKQTPQQILADGQTE